MTLDQSIQWRKKLVEEKKKKERKEREEEGRERSSTFSLVFPTIGPSIPVGARRKVLPHSRDSSRDRKLGVLTNSKR